MQDPAGDGLPGKIAVQAAELLRLAQGRRSIRRYTQRPVPAEVVERLLTAAAWAPSAHNRQPWRFVVVRGAEAKARLAEAMSARLRADRLADGDPPATVEADAARSRARITGAPVLIVACLTLRDMDVYPDSRRAQAEQLMAVQSVAMAVQNLLLTAAAEGLGACWMCAPLFCPEAVGESLNLLADWQPQALLTIGYPNSAGKPARRRGLAESVVER
ncbi:MAG: nitroreductase family protein [Anaerolineales bacterium]|nr:nitroreductase family protein [Anaerolineales bacterium]